MYIVYIENFKGTPIFPDQACLVRPECRLQKAWYLLTKSKNKAELFGNVKTYFTHFKNKN